MSTVSIIGRGSMGSAIAGLVTAGGNTAEFIGHDRATRINGEIVVLAVPYPHVADVLDKHGDKLAGKIVVDITNPVDFETFDSLVVPADTSAAEEIADRLPESVVLKAFNTTFAATLTGRVIGGLPTTVLIAGDNEDAKAILAKVVTDGGVLALDAGPLKRARELESMGFLMITLAASGKTGWTGGFAVVR